MISVLILTLNEERNLPRCLEAVSWSDDVVVLDSGSTDRTVEIAEQAGARVVIRPFDNEREHRLFSIREINFKYPWVCNPDADEVITPELRDEMQRLVADESRNEVAYRCRFKNMFMGRWIRHSSMYPVWVMRLFRPECISFKREINLEYVVDGKQGFMDAHFKHYSFNNGLNAWFDKHNRYSWHEATETLQDLDDGKMDWRGLISGDPVRRQKAIKQASFRVPCRPLMRFIYMYFVKLGFLDGMPGFHYCRLLSIYEYMITMKVAEQRRREKQLSM